MFANRYAILAHEARGSDLPEHLADDDRPVKALRDLGVPATERDAKLIARDLHISHDRVDELGRGGTFRKEQHHKEPQGPGAHDGHVVGIDVDRIPPDVIGGKRDGVGRDDQATVARIDDGCVLSNLRADD